MSQPPPTATQDALAGPLPPPRPWPRQPLYLALALALLTTVVWQGCLRNGFVNFDDPDYVTENPVVRAGLTAAGLRWALTAVVSANWHPLTLFSHMLDCQLYGLYPRGHHLTNLLLHLGATLLLFELLRRATRRPLPSAMVAALFAVHPTHVESVAWVAERKDVLCAFLWMSTLLAYLRYCRRPGLGRYLLVGLALALALAAKPMAVTLPLVLLLLDVWPLGRLPLGRSGSEPAPGPEPPPAGRPALSSRILEKLPLLVLAAATAAAALHTQRAPLAMTRITPLPLRLANALTSYAAYIGETFWPAHLGVAHPFPQDLSITRPGLALLLLLAISGLAFKLARRAPYLAVGWLWYLVTLAPVIGIVQVGKQGMADRYTYLPSIGLYLMVVWGLADLAAGPRRRGALAVAAMAAIAALSWRTEAQIATWRDSVTLFRHSLTVADTYLAHVDLADALAAGGDRAGAYWQYRAALAIEPGNPKGRAGLGIALESWGRPAEAVRLLEGSLRIDPDAEAPRIALGMALDDLGETSRAIAEIETVLARHPESIRARFGLASLLEKRGDAAAALAQYRLALAAAPQVRELYPLTANLMVRSGDMAGAADVFRRWLAIDPDAAAAHAGLAHVLDRLGQPDEARRHQETARALAAAPRQR